MIRLKKLAANQGYAYIPKIDYSDNGYYNDSEPVEDNNLQDSINQLANFQNNAIKLLRDNGLIGVNPNKIKKFKIEHNMSSSIYSIQKLFKKDFYDINNFKVQAFIDDLCITFGVTKEWLLSEH